MTGSFVDTVDVRAILVPPPSYAGDMDRKISEVRSHAGTIEDIWQFFFGESLIEMLVTPISGNWGEMRSIADGWDNLAKASAGVQENLNNVNEALAATWEGDAWHASYRYMNEWYGALGTEREIATRIAEFMRDMAENAEAAFDMIISTLNLVIDIVLYATKIINAIKALKKAKEAAGLVKKIRKLIKELKKIFDNAVAYVDALAKCIEEGNDSVYPPDGSVFTPRTVDPNGGR